MTARSEAVRDIVQELRKENKCFLAFHRELNAPIRHIVKTYSDQQDKIKS